MRIIWVNYYLYSYPLSSIRIMKNKNYKALGIALGAGVGTAFGVAMDNIGMGVAVGMGIGIAVGASMEKRKNEEL